MSAHFFRGGIEHAFTRHLVGRVEYLYDDFSDKDHTGVTGDPYRVSLTGQTVRGALAFKFDQTSSRLPTPRRFNRSPRS